MKTPEITLDTLKELRALLDMATPGEWWNESEVIHCSIKENHYPHICSMSGHNDSECEDAELICALKNNATELLRLAEIGKRSERLIKDAVPLTREELDKINDNFKGYLEKILNKLEEKQ